MCRQPPWFERGDYAKISDLSEPSLIELFRRLEQAQNHFMAQLDKCHLEWNLPWPHNALHQWSRQWEYPYVAHSIPDRASYILDAGSGFTFFPFYLATLGHHVCAVDCDPKLKKYYNTFLAKGRLSAKGNKTHGEGKVTFSIQDLASLSFESNSFDMVYCISVLEHLCEKKAVLKEFSRILKPGGLLILTCDISLDGSADISLPVFFDMLKVLESLFEHISIPMFRMDDDTLTTDFIEKQNPAMLPWCKPKFRLRWVLHPRFYIHHKQFTEVNFHSLAVAGLKLRVK